MKRFATKIERQSAPVMELSDIERMQKYWFNLMKVYVYEQPKNKKGVTDYKKLEAIRSEIHCVNNWLDKNFGEFINDNNRKFMY